MLILMMKILIILIQKLLIILSLWVSMINSNNAKHFKKIYEELIPLASKKYGKGYDNSFKIE